MSTATMPRSEIRDGRLFIDGQRALLVGGELHNSSASTPAEIRRSFEKMRDLGADTVLAPICWEQFEPAEGAFDTALIDEMIAAGHELSLRVIPLWFGAWKNAMSMYAPSWVKLDTERFPRAVAGERAVEHVSVFGEALLEVESRTFRTFAEHIVSADPHGVIPLLQIENEIGLLGAARDTSPLAETAYRRAVPADVIEAVAAASHAPIHAEWQAHGARTEGSWAELFGESETTSEAFMATAFARHVQRLAVIARETIGIPTFVNAWLDSEKKPEETVGPALAGGMRPGIYPSGGPVLRVAPIWRALAPALDFLSPDIYHGVFDDICRGYREQAGTLFIPEMRRRGRGIGQMFRAVGEHGAIGVSPFGVDSFAADADETSLYVDALGQLRAVGESLRQHPEARTRGFGLKEDDGVQTFVFGEYELTVDTRSLALPTEQDAASGHGVIVEEAPGVFLIAGRGFRLSTRAVNGRECGILSAIELEPGSGHEVRRHMNGDETGSGASTWFPELPERAYLHPALPFPAMTGRTGIARITLYTF